MEYLILRQLIIANYNVYKIIHPFSILTKVSFKNLAASKVPVLSAYELK